MAFLPHAQRWRALAVLVAWLLLSSRSGALQAATGHAELGRQICLDWARKDGKNAEPTDTRNNLGIPDRDRNRIEEARKEYEETLKTYRELAQKDPETYLPYVTTMLNNLGILDSTQNRMKEARNEQALTTVTGILPLESTLAKSSQDLAGLTGVARGI